jgi:endonuclease
VLDSLQYSAADGRENKSNPSKIPIDGNVLSNLRDYRNAVQRYYRFINESGQMKKASDDNIVSLLENVSQQYAEEKSQRITLERDMQSALRKNIKSLGSTLEIIDDGAERGVKTGFIDITCRDMDAIVVVELKAGIADSRAIGQILGYMGDLTNEEEGKQIKGILVANDFDQRCKAAARMVPSLTLKKYSIEFKFTSID